MPFLLLLIGVKALQLANEVGDHIAHLAQILGGHLGEGCFGEIADLLLAGRAVLQHLLAVGDIDLLGKLIHHGLLLGGQVHLCLRGRGSGGLFLLRHSSGGGSSVRVGTAGASRSKFRVLSAISDSFLSKIPRECSVFYLLRPCPFSIFCKTVRSADRSMLSAAYRASSWFSNAVAMEAALCSTSARMAAAFSPRTPCFASFAYCCKTFTASGR